MIRGILNISLKLIVLLSFIILICLCTLKNASATPDEFNSESNSLSADPSSFTIYWKYSANQTASQAPKRTTIKYGYLENGSWQPLPSPHKNNISKQLNDQDLLNKNDWFMHMGATSSYFDAYQYNQQIEYNDDIYSFSDCALKSPNTSGSGYFQFTKMAWCSSNDNGDSPWKMYYANELVIKTGDNPTYLSENGNDGYKLKWYDHGDSFQNADHDIYMVYKKNVKNADGSIASDNYFDVQMGNKGDPYAMDHCWVNCDAVDNDGNHLFYLPNNFLGKPVVYQPNTNCPDSSIVNTKTINYLNLYEYFGRYIKYKDKYYTFDAADLTDNRGHNATGIVGVCLTLYTSDRTSNRWCYCTKPTGSSSTYTYTWTRPYNGFDTQVPTYCTAHFKEVDMSKYVDNIDLGININLHDYDGTIDISDTNRSVDNGSINKCSPFDFSKGAGWGSSESERYGRVQWGFNKYEEFLECAVHTGIFTNKLNTDSDSSTEKNDVSKHYPVLSKSIKSLSNPYNSYSEKNLNYLFLNNVSTDSSDGGWGYKRNYSNLNHLFKKTDDGFYEFDASKNFAQISGIEDPAGSSNSAEETVNEVVVYDQPNKMHHYSSSNNCMPLNTLNARSSQSQNYLFSIDANMNFVQPPNGKIESDDMYFEFNGDDDLAIFIDDVLVLDMMGIHQPLQGSINFATGVVKRPYDMSDIENKFPSRWVRDGEDKYKAYKRQMMATNTDDGDGYLADYWKNVYVTELNLYDLYVSAGAQDDTYWKPNASGKQIFADYSKHTFKMVYFERGMGDSNCAIKFNLLSIPSKPLEIGKTTTTSPNVITSGSSDASAASDRIYKYYIAKKEPGTEIYNPVNGKCLVYKGAVGEEHTEDKLVDAERIVTNGILELPQDQVALFPDFWDRYEYATYEFLDGINAIDQADKWAVEGYFDDTKQSMEKQELGDNTIGLGRLNTIADAKEGIEFSNNLKLYNFIARNDGEKQKEIVLKFGPIGSEKPYVGKYYKNNDLSTPYTTTDGKITFGAGEIITIKDVEQNTYFTFATVDGSTDMFTSTTGEGTDYPDTRIVSNTKVTNLKTTTGQIWDKMPDSDADNYTIANFELEEAPAFANLNLKKSILGAFADKTKKFDLSVSVKDSTGSAYAPSGDFPAVITRKDSSTQNVTLVYDSTSKEIMIKGTTNTPINLGDEEQIDASGILPNEGSVVVAEVYDSDFSATGIINDGDEFEMPYNETSSRFVSESQPYTVSYDVNVLVKNNSKNVVHTMFKILDYWWLITLIVVCIAVVGRAIYKNRVKNTYIDIDEGIWE